MSGHPLQQDGLSVCQIISSFRPIIGGAERATENLSSQLVKQGTHVVLLTRWHQGLERRQVIDNIPVWRIGLDGHKVISASSFLLTGLYHLMWDLQRFDIVHTQNIDMPLIIGMVAAVLLRKKLVVTIQGEPPILLKRRTALGRLRLQFMSCLADHFIAITEENERVLREQGITAEGISRIPNGVDTDYFRPPQPEERAELRAKHNYAPNEVVVLYMGRLIFRKRVDLLLHAFAHIDPKLPARCVVVGTGEEVGKLRRLTEELGIEARVEFPGPTDKVRDYYWASDIFVLPSMFEGLPVALLESMACGMAVLVTRSPGNLQIVKDRVNGMTCEIGDLADLSQHLKTLIEDVTIRTKLGSEARRTVVSEYSTYAVAKAHLKVYRQVLGHLRKGRPGE